MAPRVPRPLLWATAILSVLGSSEARANGHGRYAQTVYYDPTELVVPSSYVLPTSYVVPTTYAYYSPTVYTSYTPTVYTSTSYAYYSPTSYVTAADYLVPTTYRYRTRPYRYVPTTYSYYLPTVYESPIVATAATLPFCNETTIPFAPPAAPSRATGSGSGTGGKPIDSTATNGKREPGLNAGAAKEPAGDASAEDAQGHSPPAAPAAKEKGNAEAPGEAFPVLPVPGEGVEGDQPKVQREARRPAFDAKNLQLRPRPAQASRMLRGRVLSATSGEAEPGVKVTFSNKGGRFDNREFTSNAQGQFEVAYLPDGDWAVEVEDAKGKAVAYATLTISGGRVTDENGREWSSLTLNR